VFAVVLVFEFTPNPGRACPLPPAAVCVGRDAVLVEIVTSQSQPGDERGPFA
jgi:hypothetical protein